MDFSNIKPNTVLAEFVGTFALAFAVLASINGILPTVATPIIAALTLGLFVMSVGGISGTHINPGVTLGLFSIKKINAATAVAYIIAQVAGAMAALGVMNLVLDGIVAQVASADADIRTLAAEAIGMAVFTFGVAAAVLNKNEGATAGFLVGGSLLLGIIFASVASNGVLNPAVAWAIDSINWSYILGPIIGAIVGMNLYSFIFSDK